MKLIDININYFMAEIVKNSYFLFLHWNPVSLSLSSHKKKRKMKFDPKIECGTSKETNHLIIKKDERLK